MKTRALLVFLCLAGCDKKQDAAPAPTTAPKPEGVAPAPAPVPKDCPVLRLTLSKDGVTHTRGDSVTLPMVAGSVDPDELGASLAIRAAKCVGDVTVAAADDVTYQDLVTVMDVAVKEGFTSIALDDAAAAGPRKRPLGSARAALKDLPVVVVTATEVSLGDTKLPIAAPDLEAKLGAALAAHPPAAGAAGALVLQADQATTGKTLNTIVRAGRANGYDDVLFAVKNK